MTPTHRPPMMNTAELSACAPDLAFALELQIQRSIQFMRGLEFKDAAIIDQTIDGIKILERSGVQLVSRLVLEVQAMARERADAEAS